ncbi:right-handed parallel beta-helix repeat-containing protein [Spirosoma montaniterrae]|uniref:Right handed beta helix domain-containing protein n=1 Tax=Spirosoma montaniterrae TaxID=1178516 RepID=A0A1P9WZA2_9BACT|nr:right-handed parallel beta-helix repeat-containing protein [Spirosoma montaniterrae]AQG80711.1 hypothetical protein AWR27_16095 [Spirosoma montaniterrae]
MITKSAFFAVALALTGLLSGCTKETGSASVAPVDTVPAKATAAATAGQLFYVSGATGNDSRTATQAQNPATPWKTIQKGVSSLPGGATLVISGGIYTEKVVVPASANGTAQAPTVIRSKQGETATLDGQNTGSQWEGLWQLKNNQYITLKGLKAQNGFWYGFSGESSGNILIDSCSTVNTRASGIYVKTTSNLTIRRNNVRKACQEPGRDASGNGAQECITVAAVQNFTIVGNEVWDNPVVGEGGEGIDAKAGSTNGEITQNYVHDLVELGIYVDAGSRESHTIRVHANRIINCAGGLFVAGELGGTALDIYFYNNLVVNGTSSGFQFQSTGNGRFVNIYVVNNTFYNNGQKGFAGDVSNFSKNTTNSNLVIRNNIFYNKTANYRYSIWHDLAAPHVISNNLFFDFKPSNNGTNSFTSSNLTGADLLIDPLFANATSGDFTLKPTSPAINKGAVILLSGTPLFTTDLIGKPRGANGTRWDMGAYEN